MADIVNVIRIEDYNKMTDEQKAALYKGDFLAVIKQDWSQVKIDAAIRIMSGIVAYAGTKPSEFDLDARIAVDAADALVAEMQKRCEEK